MRAGLLSLGLLVILVAGCAQPAASPATNAARPAAEPAPSRTLTSLLKVEPESLAAKPLRSTGTSIAHAVRVFNAGLIVMDGQENPRPDLAEAVPQLNTDSWRVFPDGGMETTFRLKPDLVWHDGQRLTAEDFVFAWGVYATPGLGVAGSTPLNQMQEVSAPDNRTVVIRWRNPYPDAHVLVATQFQALPSHLLRVPFEQMDSDAFASHPFWTAAYVGLGPYRIERWEPGAFIQGVAFDRHVLGKPRIDRVVVRFTPDENTGLSNLLSGEVQLVTDRTIRFEQAQVLQQEWGPSRGGTVILTPNQPRFMVFQHRPEYADPPLIMDPRVHQAIVHGIDKQALNDAFFDGQGVMSNTLVTPQAKFFAEADRVITKYPFDSRRVDELLGEVGLVKGRDGQYTTASGEKFAPEILAETVGQFQREQAVLMATWRTVGIETSARGLPSVQIRDGPARAIFPAMLTASASPAWQGGAVNLGNWTTTDIKTATNGWRGSNFAGWSNPDYDRLWNAYNSTLDSGPRTQQVIEMARLLTVNLPIFDLYWNPNITAHLATLRGPDPRALDTLVNWNVHEWEII